MRACSSQLHLLSVAASYAFRTSRALLVPSADKWWFTDSTDCPERAWQCYMKTLSTCGALSNSCRPRHIVSGRSAHCNAGHAADPTELGSWIESGGEPNFRDAAVLGVPDAEKARVLHAGYKELRSVLDTAEHRCACLPRVRQAASLMMRWRSNARPDSQLWLEQPLLLWRAVLVGWLFRPKVHLLQRASAVAARSGWTTLAEPPSGVGLPPPASAQPYRARRPCRSARRVSSTGDWRPRAAR